MIIKADIYTFSDAKETIGWEPKNIKLRFGDMFMDGKARLLEGHDTPGIWAKAEFRLEDLSKEEVLIVNRYRSFNIISQMNTIGYADVIKSSDF